MQWRSWSLRKLDTKKHEKHTETLLKINRLGIREVAEDINNSYGSIQHILVNDLGIKRDHARLIPKDLTFWPNPFVNFCVFEIEKPAN